MLTEDAVWKWLMAEGVEAGAYWDGTPFSVIQDPRAVILTLDGGGASIMERTFDTVALQVLTRGDQADHAGARNLAWQIDQVLYGSVGPFTLTGAYVLTITRIGGPPKLLDMDSARRFIFTCNYLFTVART